MKVGIKKEVFLQTKLYGDRIQPFSIGDFGKWTPECKFRNLSSAYYYKTWSLSESMPVAPDESQNKVLRSTDDLLLNCMHFPQDKISFLGKRINQKHVQITRAMVHHRRISMITINRGPNTSKTSRQQNSPKGLHKRNILKLLIKWTKEQ